MQQTNSVPVKKSALWGMLSALAVWLLICTEINTYDIAVIVPQHQFGRGLDFNGIEYAWFGIPALLLFLLNIGIYHFGRLMKRGLARTKDDSL